MCTGTIDCIHAQALYHGVCICTQYIHTYHLVTHLYCSTLDHVERVRVVDSHSDGPPQCDAVVGSHLWGQIRHQSWTDCVLSGYAKDDRWVWRVT